MPIDYAEEAYNTGKAFQQVADAITQFVLQAPPLGDDVNARLTSLQNKLLYNADQFFDKSDEITFGADQQYFSKVDQATKAINANLKTIQTTDKWINFAGAVVGLGTSILTGDGGGIVSAAGTILSTFNINPAES